MPGRGALLSMALILGAGAGTPLHAQFGRNKVQYRAFEFRVVRTEHFDVHFYPEERAAAMDAARMAERSYERLSRLLRHEFRERKPIILYASHAHFQQTNALRGLIDEGTGGVTEILKNRVILPFTGSYADFDHVLTHELVHAFQFDVLLRDGLMADAGMSAGRLPLWFMEGMAEYLALGRVDAHTASWVRDAVLTGYIRSIDDMNRRDDYLSYRFGQSLWAYIGATWGDEAIGVLLQKAPRVGMERAFESTLGVTLAALSDAWLAHVRELHLPAMTRRRAPEAVAHRLTPARSLDDPWYLAPALSPDGEALVFASQRDGFFMDLWLADGRTGKVQAKLVEGSRSPGFESLRFQSSAGSFSPDGSLVAFTAQTGGADALYLYDVRRRRVWRKLTFPLDGIDNPAWSPDGDRLVFTGLEGGVSDLYVTDLRGGLARLTRDPFADLQPAWSPDGRTIAFSSDRGPTADLGHLRYGNVRVALLDLASGRIDVLPHQEEGKNINPAWSPDGRELAWVGDRTGVNNLYLFDLDTGELRQVTDVLTGIIGTNHLTPVLSWARKSGRMVFVYFEKAGYTLYALDDPRTLPTVRRFGGPASPLMATGPPIPEGEGRPARAVEAGGHGGTSGQGAGALSGGGAVADAVEVAAEPGAAAAPDTAAAGARPGNAEGSEAAFGGGFSGSYYRSPEGLRESSALPAGPGPGAGPVSVMALLDSVDLALPDTAGFEVERYRVRFTPDIVGRPSLGVQTGGYYGNGVYGGSFISLSDMLGNHNVVLAGNMNGSLADGMFYGGYGFYRHRANLTLALQQRPLYRYRGFHAFSLEVDGEARDVMANVFLRDVIRSADAVVEYPFNPFRRVELGGRLAYFQRDNLYRGYVIENDRPVDVQERLGSMTYYEPSLAMVFDNTLFGWTGPVQGRRYRLQASSTRGDIAFTEGLVDVRNYWNWRRRLVLAVRGVALVRSGRDSDRFSLYWGGPYFIRGYDGGSFATGGPECEAFREGAGSTSPSLCPVRDQLIGSSGAFVNTELRLPVITELRLGPLGQFPPVDGVLFFDGGLAWDERVCEMRDFDPTRPCSGESRPVHVVWRRDPGQNPYFWRQPLFSWGFGLRVNVFYAVLRLDYAFPLNRERDGVFSLAFGPSF